MQHNAETMQNNAKQCKTMRYSASIQNSAIQCINAKMQRTAGFAEPKYLQSSSGKSAQQVVVWYPRNTAATVYVKKHNTRIHAPA
jgi:hypothetical protein